MANIKKRGNTYNISVSCGYTPQGKQIRKYMTWKPAPNMTEKQIKKELERQKVLFEEKVLSGQCVSGDLRFSEFAERWFLDYAEKQLKPRTIQRYREHLERINPMIGHIRMDKLQPAHIMSLYDKIAAERQDNKYRAKINLKEQMNRKNVTRAKLHELSGVSKGTITNAWNGKNITENTADKIAKALQTKRNAIFEPVVIDTALAPMTVRHYHQFLSSVLSTAVYWQIIPSNPCQRVKPPKAENKEAKYLDEKDFSRLLVALEGEPIQYKTLIYLLLYTGMRRGEAMGLEWKDIDFEKGVIHIQRTSAYLPGRGVFEDTAKNKTSVRSIHIDAGAGNMLKEYRAYQNAERLKIGSLWKDTDRLFTQWDGSPMNPDTPSGWFHNFVKRHELPNICLHSLRHTHASLLIANHADIRTVSGRLGHARTSTTMDIYSHLIRSADKEAACTIEKVINATARH